MSYNLNKFIYVPHHVVGWGGGNIVFSADPVGVRVASCLHSYLLI